MSQRYTAADLMNGLPTPVPDPAAAQPSTPAVAPAHGPLTLVQLITGIAVGLILGFLLWGNASKRIDGDRQDDKQEQRQEQKHADAKGVWVVIVEESSDRGSHTHVTDAMNDLDYWSSLKARGVEWRVYDRDSDTVKPYLADAEKVGLPALLVISPKGDVLSSATLKQPNVNIQSVIEKVIGK